jgi:D-cysteine desulfhydrase
MLLHPAEPPRLSLANLPTPILSIEKLCKKLGVPTLLLKRDDLTGMELSGNKIRKLEYLLADAINSGCNAVVTHGGYQSNHCRATAAACARLGLRCRLILRAPSNNAADLNVNGNLLLDYLFGADVEMHPPEVYNGQRQALIDSAMERLRQGGKKPYFFPVGASVPLGCWGYVRCLAELAEQLGRERDVVVYTAVSSSGTHAGLILGQALLGLRRYKIVGIPVSDSVEFFQQDIRKLVDATIAQFGLGLTAGDTPIHLLEGYIGGGYAIPTERSLQALGLLAQNEAILLDPTYTSKAMAGVLDQLQLLAQQTNPPTPVFIHTGGAFGLLARTELFDWGQGFYK